jgi:hypothetical protein
MASDPKAVACESGLDHEERWSGSGNRRFLTSSNDVDAGPFALLLDDSPDQTAEMSMNYLEDFNIHRHRKETHREYRLAPRMVQIEEIFDGVGCGICGLRRIGSGVSRAA